MTMCQTTLQVGRVPAVGVKSIMAKRPVSPQQRPRSFVPGKPFQPTLPFVATLISNRQRSFPVLSASGGGGGTGGAGGKSVAEDDGDNGLPVVPIIVGAIVLFVLKKLYDIYFALRGDPESPEKVGPFMVLGGFKDWLFSPFPSKKEEEPEEEKGQDAVGYIIAGSLFLVAVALVKIISGSDGGTA